MDKQDYKDYRFDFTIYVNDFIITKRNFKIPNYVEGSMDTVTFKYVVDNIVRMIDEDLKDKSIVYTTYYFNPNDVAEEFSSPLSKPWESIFKIVISDNKKPILTRIWDGYGYPRAIRDRVDLTNKKVRITNKSGQVFTYDKEDFFKDNNRLSLDLTALKEMIYDKQDVLMEIINTICNTCSCEKNSSPKEFLEEMGTTDEYYFDADSTKYKKYNFNISNENYKRMRKIEKEYAKKTKDYFNTLY